VNAPFIARERGIEVIETKTKDSGDYQSVIGLRIKSKDREIHVVGTLFSKKDPRVILIDEFKVEIVPEGDLLLMYNNDKPGVIGNIGTLFGESNINIARMHFGRETAGGKAISVVSIDSTPTPEIMQKIRALPNILSVRHICL
jgi:D-3-phosphoglycerate dehydrogenase